MQHAERLIPAGRGMKAPSGLFLHRVLWGTVDAENKFGCNACIAQNGMISLLILQLC